MATTTITPAVLCEGKMVCTSFLRNNNNNNNNNNNRLQPMTTSLKAFPNMIMGKGEGVFGMQVQRGGRVTCKVTGHKVRIITPTGTKEFRCPENQYILDAAEEKLNIDLPYTCRAGACSSCIGKVVKGKVDMPDNSYLDDDQIAAGYVLTCVAIAKSDVVIQSHKEDEFFKEYE